MIAAGKISALSFLVLCFCLSDVSYWKHGREAGSFSALKPEGQWTSTVCSLHVQLQSSSQRPAEEPPTGKERRYAGNCKVNHDWHHKKSPSDFKGMLFVLEIILGWMINSSHDEFQNIKVLFI